MPETGIALDPDQADDLRELITLTTILQEWLEGAADHILDDLAHFAYRDTFHPRSYAAWLDRRPRRHLRPAPQGPLTPATSQNRPESRSATSAARAIADTTARSEDFLRRWP